MPRSRRAARRPSLPKRARAPKHARTFAALIFCAGIVLVAAAVFVPVREWPAWDRVTAEPAPDVVPSLSALFAELAKDAQAAVEAAADEPTPIQVASNDPAAIQVAAAVPPVEDPEPELPQVAAVVSGVDREPYRPDLDDLPAAPSILPTAPGTAASVPDVARSGRDAPAWRKHAVPAAIQPDRPAIVIVVDDLGLDRRRSRRMTELPGPLTLAYLPYARDLEHQTAEARARGHELLVHVPMEPEGPGANPGPGALLTALDATEIRRRLERDLASFDGYVGVNNHMGSRFTRNRAAMEVVLRELRARGLLFLDSRTIGSSVGVQVAREVGVPAVGRDVFLDHVDTLDAVRSALAELEAVARRRGIAIGIGHPRDATFQALAEWLPTLGTKGFQLVPLSAAVLREMGETP